MKASGRKSGGFSSNADMFAKRGNPWITERDRREGKIYSTTVRGEADLPPDKSIRFNGGVIDYKACRKAVKRVEEGHSSLALPPENKAKPSARPTYLSLRYGMRRAVNSRLVKV